MTKLIWSVELVEEKNIFVWVGNMVSDVRGITKRGEKRRLRRIYGAKK